MSKSLQDQLLGAGLIDKKKAKKITKESKKAKKEKIRSKDKSLSEEQETLIKAQQEKQEKDRELNKQRDLEVEKKAIAAQIIQLIQHYKIARRDGDIEYNFTDGNTIKKILVSSVVSDEIARGKLCIARLGESYEIIPKPIADKICERDDSAIVVANTKSSEQESEVTAEDDAYYAQFEIPDDLMW